ncbi:MAG: bis(5'-nucleosyl)-tetraphosphatase (symmetrical) YqeK [Oscillatoria sp. PMC 1051.18]|nr:bis(5'-nucleosyl)-tetraphosphatase (symmetrical) YqeK [Oscillatoria sp. PMC 1050.18]MEC5028619.1 bis(5'-nucleosyl)-tetraphosphatase (symmetrical) YqeK [Oscillatoria sp. PMC 1051.18]
MACQREQVFCWLADNVPASRIIHIQGVENMASELARCYQLDEQKAANAGLLHDLAKYFPPTRLLEIARAEKIAIDSICEANPHLLHADVSAIIARDKFGVEDEEVLAAIRNHTLGNAEMSDLSCIIYVADALEPSRGESAELEAIRQVSRKNLYQAVWQTSDLCLRHLLAKKRAIHPRTIFTRNWALAKIKLAKNKNLLQAD